MAEGADVVIVGGGTAGCVLAARLSEEPHRSVLLLEAGRDVARSAELPPVLVGHPPPEVHALPDTWRYDVELMASPPKRMNQFRGRVMGGSSSINGALFVRGIPEDYNAWGSPLWCFDQVLPFFRKMESDLDYAGDFHGSDGPLRVSRSRDEPLTPAQQRTYESALALGVAEKPDLNHPDGAGIGRVPMTLDSRSTALTYLAACRTRANLRIIPQAMVTRVVFDGSRAVGVELARDSHTAVIHADEVILTAGTFGSAQLLLRSGVGPADQLRSLGVACVADRPGVGQNLRCHPMFTLQVPTSPAATPDPPTPRLVIVHAARDRNNVMLFPRQTADALAVMVTLRLPSSSGELRLSAADPAVPPTIRYGYLAPDDLEQLREGLQLATDLAVKAQPAATVAAHGDRWIREHLETADHACGTCKMGSPDDPLAVVDDTCRVYDTQALRVVDLSIVPRPVRAGPYPTVVLVAERAAELMIRCAMIRKVGGTL